MLWHFVKWRFMLWSTRRRRRNKARTKQLKPSQTAESIITNTNAVMMTANDNTALSVPQVTTLPVLKPKRRNNKIINDVTSAMINLGMAKRKAKQHVQQCYDNMNGNPSLNELLTYSIKSLSV
jgi:hypothetical protein